MTLEQQVHQLEVRMRKLEHNNKSLLLKIEEIERKQSVTNRPRK